MRLRAGDRPDGESRPPRRGLLARLLRRKAKPLPSRRPDDAEDLRRLFDLSPQIPWLADGSGKVIRYHERWQAMLGSSDADARRAWSTAGHPDDLPGLSAAWARSIATGSAFDREHRVRLANGAYRWFRSRAFPHRNADGAIDGWYGVSEDIDEFKRTRAELDESRQRLADNEERLRLAMAGAHLGAFDWDLRSGTGWWSARSCEIAGFVSGQSVTREQHARLIAPEDRERVRTELIQILKSARDFTLEHRIMRPSGEIRWVSERGVVHRDASGRAIRMVGVTQDITEERAAAAALTASEQRLDLAMDAARFGAWEWNFGRGRGWWSPRTCEIMGVPPGTEPTLELRWGLVHPDDRDDVRAAAATANEGGVYEQRYRIVRPDGEVRWVLSRGRATYEGERTIKVSGVIQDITHDEATRRALSDSEARLQRSQEIAGIGSYEWNLKTGEGHFSPNLLRMAGLEPDARPTLPELMANVHPDDLPAVAAAASIAATAPAKAEIEYRFVRPDGTVRWARDVGATTVSADGVPYWAGVIIDITDIREVSERLADSDRLTRLTHQFAGIGTWEYTPETRMRWSPEIYRLYDRDPALGPPDNAAWTAMLHPDDIEAAMAPMRLTGPEETDFSTEFRVRRSDGGWRWLQGRGRVERTEDGEIARVLGINIDISERKLAEEALSESELRLRQTQAAGGIGSLDVDLASGRVWRSPEYCALYGLSDDWIGDGPVARDWVERVHPADRARVASWFEANEHTPGPFALEYRIVRADDGAVRWIINQGESLAGTDGRPTRLLAVQIDVTDRRVAEAALADARERMEFALKAAQMFTWEWEPEAERISHDYDGTQGDIEAVDTRPAFHDLIHPDDRARVRETFDRCYRADEPYDIEYRIRLADGEFHWVQSVGRAVVDADGHKRMRGVMQNIDARKQAEEAVQQRERQLLAFIEQAPVGIAMFDRDMRYLAVSERFLIDIGFSRDEVIGRVHYDVTPDLPERWRDIHRRAQNGEGARGEADRFERGDGRVDWVDWEVRPWLAPDGTIGGILLFAEYVTARVEAQQRLADSERLLRAIGDASLDLIFAKNRDGRMLYANTATAKVIGRPAEDLIGRRELDWAADEGEALAIMANDQRIMEAGVADVTEEVFTSPDGSQRVWRSTKVPLRSDDGDVIGLAGVSTDITALRAREDQLQQINSELQAILDAVPAAIWITRDPQALQIDGNRTSRDLLRIPQLDANMSKSANDAPVHHFDVYDVEGVRIAPADLPVQRAARGERVTDFRETIRFDDGDEVSLLGNAVPLFDEGGAPRGAVAAFVDISALERAEKALVDINASLEARVASATAEREAALAQLHEMQKLETLGQLTGGVAHDFNNLLTPIIGSLDLLRRRHGEDAREARLIDGALAAADRARVLVSRLLAFGRRQMLQPRAVDIAALVGDATEIITRTIGPQIPVRVEVPSGLPAARADPNQLELALLNLAVNARDAMPGGGQLTIAAEAVTVREAEPDLAPGSYVRLSVADSGIGMTEEVRRRAIEPFYTTKGVGKGTGLGLSMVHGFVAQLGGALRLQSAPGQGTRVEMWLPRAVETDTEVVSGGEAAATATERSATLLLVDDDDLVRAGTAEMLRAIGYTIIEATGGAEALTILRADPSVNALVTDFLMAGMTGGDLLVAARHVRPGLPALVVTGYAESETLRLDAPLLAKPYGADELAAAVAAVLEPAS